MMMMSQIPTHVKRVWACWRVRIPGRVRCRGVLGSDEECCEIGFGCGEKKMIGSAILWFKQDLRVDDHFGLVAASKYQSLVPLYVFDHRILSRLQQVRATSIFAEEEVEYHLCKMIGIVDESLATVASIDGNLEIFQWRTPFYDIKNLNDLPASYNDFTKLQLSPTSPIVSPMLPRARIELNWGDLPTFDELKEFMKKNPWKSKESWTVIKKMSAERISLEKVRERLGNAESRDGASFFALFGPAVSATVAAAADAVCSMEWYWLMALRSLTSNERKYSTRIWRWNGYLIQYTVVGHEGPAILLVHGFGAFFEHYRDNISDIANSGNRVWAITVLDLANQKSQILCTLN
ncbi:hypothetical protein LWI29_006243 [Acer saccharum]|uniref:Photolyase/cryptochrome alpha/beta domain-containing protein n=1 Tax=Acer saccharum TaxID=4024 RepID=A0AA39SQW9_ACESA|nr:hypothetical protein LWI29_006243 [Acer saccharum]